MSTTYVLVKYLYDIFKILLKNTQKFLWTTTKNTDTSKMRARHKRVWPDMAHLQVLHKFQKPFFSSCHALEVWKKALLFRRRSQYQEVRRIRWFLLHIREFCTPEQVWCTHTDTQTHTDTDTHTHTDTHTCTQTHKHIIPVIPTISHSPDFLVHRAILILCI